EYLEIKVTASLSIFIVTLLVMLYLRDQQLKYAHKEAMQQKEQELMQYNRLIDELEIVYDEIRGFRHDYAGIIRSLEPAIRRNNMEEISQIYKEALCQMNYDISQKDYSGFELSYIKNVGFRNIFSQKILQAKDEKIPFKLEVTECIPEVEVPLLATIRILTIVLDNAFEATVMTNNPSIVVGVVVENDRVIVSVKNTYDSSTMQKRYKIWEKGYSTKIGHKGLGLVNLQQLVWELDSLGLKTEINQNTFTQIISFRTKE
ncbi:GHKL domain-containing protein, partial [Granulicatella balaenopterae]